MAQEGAGVASSSQAALGWQPTFMLGGEPLPADASVRTWAQDEGGRVAQSLVSGLLLPEDVRFFSNGTKDSIVRRLQWHTIAVTFSYLTSHLLCGAKFFYFLFLSVLFSLHSFEFIIVVLPGHTDYSCAW